MPRLRPSLLLVLAIALAAPAAASAAFPGRNGLVAYVGSGRLVVRSGHTAHTLLSGGGLTGTAFSPLGRRLAISRATSSGRAVWVLDVAGAGLRQVSPAGGRAGEPAWSPGGDQLAYAEGATGKRRIYVIAADGTGVHRLTSGTRDQHDPAWSVRSRIAYVVREPTGDDVFTIAATGGRPRRLTRSRGDDNAPAWAPDGRHLVFVRTGALWIMDSAGRHARRVVRPAAGSPTAPAYSPDGRHLVFSAGRAGHRRIYRVDTTGRRLAAVSSRSADARFPDWQPAGLDPVIEAAGDIACDPQDKYFNGGAGIPRHCGQRRTGNLLLDADLSAVLPLGDEQYGHGELGKFAASYGATWGLTKALQHPVPGNHEYSTDATAAGYYDYFNGVGADSGPAGSRSQGGFYSFDVGTWHLVALNSNCDKLPGGCGPGSPEDTWLAADLAAHHNVCTLAYFHHPAFSSAKGVAMAMPLFQTLYDGGADLVLNGHHHDYERFAPQSPAGAADPARGVREIIVGTGGESIARTPPGRAANSQVFDASTFGVLRLALHPTGYDWRYLAASADPFTDAGSGACH